jgi:hypothetical protein
LSIQERAAAKRYLRALERLREILADVPRGLYRIAAMSEPAHEPAPTVGRAGDCDCPTERARREQGL